IGTAKAVPLPKEPWVASCVTQFLLATDSRLLTTDCRLEFRQHNALLRLVFAFAVGVAGFALLVRLEEDDLAKPLVGVDLGRQRRGIGNLKRHKTFPLRLKRGDVHDDAAARIG